MQMFNCAIFSSLDTETVLDLENVWLEKVF